MAPDRSAPGLIALRGPADGQPFRLATGGAGPVAFYVLPADDKAHGNLTVLLHEYTSGKDYWYAVEGDAAPQGYQRAASPVGRVWRFPLSLPPEQWK